MKKPFMLVLVLTVVLIAFTVTADEASNRAAWKASFVEACIREGSSYGACVCSADYIMVRYPGSQLLAFSLRLMQKQSTEQDRKVLVDAIVTCHKK